VPNSKVNKAFIIIIINHQSSDIKDQTKQADMQTYPTTKHTGGT
jgi:hypothetical protein